MLMHTTTHYYNLVQVLKISDFFAKYCKIDYSKMVKTFWISFYTTFIRSVWLPSPFLHSSGVFISRRGLCCDKKCLPMNNTVRFKYPTVYICDIWAKSTQKKKCSEAQWITWMKICNFRRHNCNGYICSRKIRRYLFHSII